MKAFWKDLWKRYRHFMPVLIYMVFYMAIFAYVENRPGYHLHLLSSRYDRLFPFCEYFIVPYLLWFLYMAVGVLYFGMVEREREQFYLLITNLCIGMTLFLVISLVWPNGHTLRPRVFPRDNVFTDMVRMLYRTDTSTNVLPSIHVFNSIAIHTAVAHSITLKKHPFIERSSFILCLMIIASTLFLKQHTVIDVVAAFILNAVTYYIVYQPGIQRQVSKSKSKYNNKHSL